MRKNLQSSSLYICYFSLLSVIVSINIFFLFGSFFHWLFFRSVSNVNFSEKSIFRSLVYAIVMTFEPVDYELQQVCFVFILF